MTCPNCHPAFVAGYETGLAHRCRIDTTQAEHEASHALVKPIVDAILRDMSQRGPGAHADIERRRRAGQLEAQQRNQAAARPWPPETAPLNRHALFGQPQRQPVTTWR